MSILKEHLLDISIEDISVDLAPLQDGVECR